MVHVLNSVGGVARDTDEAHRASTPLELFFDLCFVVAVAQAAAELHHALMERHFFDATLGFGMAFFGIWWAWVNFAWFASGHDSDDVPYRLLTLVQMAGVLVYAAGIHESFTNYDFTTVVAGYVIMRLGLVAMWVRVARDQPTHRARAIRYIVGVTALQGLWIARLALPDDRNTTVVSFGVIMVLEMLSPIYAERRTTSRQFHPEHLAERFGLFTIIVLGEGILSATVAIREAVDAVGLAFDVLVVAGAGLVIVFTVWWAYFGRDDVPSVDRLNGAFIWGYGHLPVFAGLAAFAAGIHVAVEFMAGHGSQRVAALAVTLPIALATAGFTLIGATTGTPAERQSAARGVVVIAVVIALGLVASLKIALVGMAVVLVAATIAQGAALGRRVGLAESPP